MQAVLNYFTLDKGWSQPLPALDSPQTLVIVFCHPEFKHYQTALEDIHDIMPNPLLLAALVQRVFFMAAL